MSDGCPTWLTLRFSGWGEYGKICVGTSVYAVGANLQAPAVSDPDIVQPDGQDGWTRAGKYTSKITVRNDGENLHEFHRRRRSDALVQIRCKDVLEVRRKRHSDLRPWRGASDA